MDWWDRSKTGLRQLLALPQLETAGTREFTHQAGTQPIAEAKDRAWVRVNGVIRSIAIGPRGPSATFEVELDDGTGVLRVVWLGQRQVLGLEPGRVLVCEGRLALERGIRVMRNPRYQLVPVGAAS